MNLHVRWTRVMCFSLLLLCPGLVQSAVAADSGNALVFGAPGIAVDAAASPSHSGLFLQEAGDAMGAGSILSNFARPALAQQWNEEPGGPASENFRSIAFSALLPGLAQWKLGHHNRALGFWIAEAAIWTGYTSYQVQGHVREDSYLEMATLYAGVSNVDDRDDDYLRRIASWPSSDLFDDLIIRRNARTFSGDDPVAREEYFQENRIAADDRWGWESSAARNRYSDKRSDSKTAFKRSRNMLGLAVANRVVAMIDAVVLSNRQNDSAYHLRMEPRRSGEHWEGRLSLSRSYR